MPLDPYSYEPYSAYSQRREPAVPLLPKEEEDSLLSKIAGSTMSGLGYVGGVLDKTFGGGAIRGALGGKPRELLSLIPGSDTFGLTDESDVVRGRDLLDPLLGQSTPGFDLGDIAGFGADVLLDPATYLSLGGSALTKAGRAAKNLGREVVPKSWAGRIKGWQNVADIPEAGLAKAAAAGVAPESLLGSQQSLFGLGIPFMDPAFNIGTGETAQKIAGYLGKKGERALYSAPGRALSAMFSSPVESHTTEPVQRAFRDVAEAHPGIHADYRKQIIGAYDKLEKAGVPLGERGNVVRDWFEGQTHGPNPQPLDEALGEIGNYLKSTQPKLRALGIDATELENMFPRQSTPPGVPMRGYGPPRGRPPLDPNLPGREDELRNLPASVVNAMSMDPAISGPERTLRKVANPLGRPGVPPLTDSQLLEEAAHIRQNFSDVQGHVGMTPAQEARMFELQQGGAPARNIAAGLSPTETDRLGQLGDKINQAVAGGPGLTGPEMQEFNRLDTLSQHYLANPSQVLNPAYDEWLPLKTEWDRSFKLAERMAKLDPKHAAEQIPLFGHHSAEDLLLHAQRTAKSESRGEGLMGAFARTAAPLEQAGPGAVPLKEAMEKAGATNWKGGLTTLAERMGMSVDDAAKLHVPADVAGDLSRATAAFTKPEAASGLLNVIDSATALFKAFVSPVWPAYHMRNLAQGAWMQYVRGMVGPTNAVSAYRDGMALTRQAGGIAQEANKVKGLTSLSAAEATREIQKEMMVHKIVSPDTLTREAALAQTELRSGTGTFNIPGTVEPQSIGSIIKGGVPTSLQDVKDLWKVRGVGDITQDIAKPVAAGRQLDRAMDDTMRATTYLQARLQGMAPEVAAQEVFKTHYDYGNLSGFEKSVMRRAIPFYSWLRQNMPRQVEELFEHPGGKTAMGVRAAEDLHAKTGFIPQQVGEGLALPIGGEDQGSQRFLSGLGLPFEDAFRDLGVGRGVTGNVEKTLASIGGELNPLLKAPMELATGRQLRTGRELGDLYGPTGNVLLDQAVMNSPLSRFYTTGRTLADERKGVLAKALNLASPVRLTDVEMEKAKEIAGREAVKALTQNVPEVKHFESLYVKPDDVGKLTPEELLLVQLNKGLEKRAAERSRQDKKEIRVY